MIRISDLDIVRTRARLAAVARQLAADPDNEALRWEPLPAHEWSQDKLRDTGTCGGARR
jgi:hypothetical protein